MLPIEGEILQKWLITRIILWAIKDQNVRAPVYCADIDDFCY